jgi:hypothetical protein
VRLTRRRLNRTLLQRQRLLERTDSTPEDLARHLVGLQAQENLPPYLSLAARVADLDPYAVTRALEERALVRLLTMRGTVHLLVAEDALVLRPWTQPRMDQEARSSQSVGAAREVDRDEFETALREVLADGPLPQRHLAEALGQRFPDFPPNGLGQLARVVAPLVQLPPRGCWKRSGGVVYDYVDRWTGGRLVPPDDVDVERLVRRYLAAFGPATAADVTAWSGVTRLGPVLAGMDDLVRHEDERGRVLYDVPDGRIAEEGVPSPVRLLGAYDNVWLSHAGRDRVTDPEKRTAWMGTNGGVANTLFVDGWLEGLWRVDDGRVQVVDTFRTLSRPEKSELAHEIDRVQTLLER